MPESPAHEWLRDRSKFLKATHEASRKFRHSVVKGDVREYDIIELLAKLLPESVAVEAGVVIVNPKGVQAGQTDGVIHDRMNFPRLYSSSGKTVVMLESVLATIEVKSSLAKGSLDEIFKGSQRLHDMGEDRPHPLWRPAPTAFAHACSNMNLYFYDYAVAHWAKPEKAPTLICVLTQGVFAQADQRGDLELRPARGDRLRPTYIDAGDDSLLVYLYWLSTLGARGEYDASVEVFRQYTQEVLQAAAMRRFDDDFLDVVAGDNIKRETARKAFQGKAGKLFVDVYEGARAAVGLA